MMDDHKQCNTCFKAKPLSDFYKNAAMIGGHTKECKECKKASVRKNYAEKKPQYQAYEKTRANLPHRVQARAEYAKTEASKLSHQKSDEKYRESEHGKEQIRLSRLNWLENNRIKRAAHVIYGNWLRYNKETKPTSCAVCGSIRRLDAHHDDYFKPLEVRHLCRKCHVSWHNENGGGLNGAAKQETK